MNNLARCQVNTVCCCCKPWSARLPARRTVGFRSVGSRNCQNPCKEGSPERTSISAEIRARHERRAPPTNPSLPRLPDLFIFAPALDMPDESDYYAALTFCGTALLACSRIPQLVLVLKRQSARDLSYTSQVCALPEKFK